jgi:membrane dipeptidase
MLIVDAHLDLSYNALRGREVLRPAAEQTRDEEGIPTVGLPDLRAGGVGLVCSTIFCSPAVGDAPGYRDADEAHAVALRHLKWYQGLASEGVIRFVTTPAELPGGEDGGWRVEDSEEGNAGPPASSNLDPLPAILLLEGADPLRSPADVAEWFAAGLRIVGLAWKRTRHAGGTGAPGPLTAEGVEMVRELDAHRVIHDLSHLAEESFWQLLDLSAGAVMASHSNCRAIVPTDRQLSDEMIRAIVERDGVIGINFFDKFLLPPGEYGKRRATLADVARHARHVCDLAGDARHVGIGTDMDGGLGRDEIPTEITTAGDLPRVAEALASAGFGEEDVRGIMGDNWLSFFRRALPESPRVL